MLQLLNDYNEEIEFFIVSTKFNGTEVIKVRDIPNIIDSLPYEYIVASNYGEVETEAWVKRVDQIFLNSSSSTVMVC